MTDQPDVVVEAAAAVDAALDRLSTIVARLADGDLHRAHRDGGWSVAQVISHINACALIWLGDLERLRHDPEVSFFFREEVGHDARGYPPPSVDIALRQLGSTRRSLATCLPAAGPELLERTVQIPDLGTMTVAEWTPLVLGHLTGHVDQAVQILQDRDAMPAGI